MQKRSSTVPQTLISIQSYAGSKGMAGSVLRSKMRSLRQGKAEESKGPTTRWVVGRTPWRSHADGKVRVINRNTENMGRTA